MKLECKLGQGIVAEQLMKLLCDEPDVKFAVSRCNACKSDCVKLSRRVSLVSKIEDTDDNESEQVMPVNDKFENKMKLLIKELQLNCKTLLACAWTTKEESRRFKMRPWASTWDVVEGLNSESRPFLWV